MSLDGAIANLQTKALNLTTVIIKSAPNHPVESAEPFPMSVAHLATGSATLGMVVRVNPVVQVDFMFSRTNLSKAYTDIDAVAIEYLQILGGDPLLSNNVDSIVNPVTFSVSHQQWDTVPCVVLTFLVTLKTLQAHT